MVMTIAIGLWALLLAGRGTPIGAWLERWLVAKPAAALSRIRRHTVLAVGALAITAALCWWVIGHEGLLVFGFGLPEMTSVFAMIDLGMMFDIAVVVVATASTGMWRAIRVAVQRHAPRARRARRVRGLRKPAANDDGDGPGFALAA